MLEFILKAIITGFPTGLAASIPLGPSGLESVKRSISNGFRAGFKVSLGAICADVSYLFLINFGLASFFNETPKSEALFWVVSGVILFLFNKLSNRKKHDNSEKNNALLNSKYGGFISGFTITFLNPMTPSLWLALSTTVLATWRSYGDLFFYIALASMISGCIFWFILLNIFASRGVKMLKSDKISNGASNILKYFLYILSFAFIGYGILQLLTLGG